MDDDSFKSVDFADCPSVAFEKKTQLLVRKVNPLRNAAFFKLSLASVCRVSIDFEKYVFRGF